MKPARASLRGLKPRAHRICPRNRCRRECCQCDRRCHGRNHGKEDDEQMQGQRRDTNGINTGTERDDDNEIGRPRRQSHAEHDRAEGYDNKRSRTSGPPASCARRSDRRPLKPDTWIRPTIRPIAVTITMIDADMRPALTKAL